MPVSQEARIVAIESIQVSEDRQRRKFDEEAMLSLASSIRRIGLIHPIVVDRENRLVAGERRLRAIKSLGWTQVLATYQESATPAEAEVIELEENLKRSDLTWQEQVDAIWRLHSRLGESQSEWSADKTASVLGLSGNHVRSVLAIAREAKQDPTILTKASGVRAAANTIARKNERETDALLAKVFDVEESNASEVLKGPQVIEADFHTWAESYTGEPFNFIHCDFPYGINMDTSKLQGTRKDLGRYPDSEETYVGLCKTLLAHEETLISPSAHLMFWFSMGTYEATRQTFESCGFTVNPFPLIWVKEDLRGILPDPQRGPRRVYETAFLMYRGDRKIVKPVANAFVHPTSKSDALHLSEKPEAVLRHFFQMFVDKTTRLLDPTCGGGTALAAARDAEVAVGIEIDPQNVAASRNRLAQGKILGEIQI